MTISLVMDKLAYLGKTEQLAYRRYITEMGRFKDPKVVALMRWLADEENRHVRMVDEMHIVLEKRKEAEND